MVPVPMKDVAVASGPQNGHNLTDVRRRPKTSMSSLSSSSLSVGLHLTLASGRLVTATFDHRGQFSTATRAPTCSRAPGPSSPVLTQFIVAAFPGSGRRGHRLDQSAA